MSIVDSFSDTQTEALARVLGDCGTGSQITDSLNSCGLEDKSGESTKWKRLRWVFLESQRQNRCANGVINFTQTFLDPVRFRDKNEEFESHRRELNMVSAFAGLEYGADGKFCRREAVQTISDAEQRVDNLQAKFKSRRIHPKALWYCRAELMQENYFHAVFEAAKGLAQRIREMSGVTGDGVDLVNRVFSVDKPVLAFNSLQTKTEKSEYRGFANLLRGCFEAIRNPLAHEPKILWEGEDDAADYLTLISLLHWKPDDCFPTRMVGPL